LGSSWHSAQQDGSKKQPFYVNMGEGNVMCMAGLYDTYRDAAGALHYTYTILTVDSSNRLEW
jgi:putative SOS response-associated peptidase YedK